MKIKMSKHYIDKCTAFAKERMKGSSKLYQQRGEQNFNKMEQDILIGTLAEWASFKYLQSKGIKTSKPDMKIYTSRKKSFAADLLNEEYMFHIKSQSKKSADLYGFSWLFQKTDKLFKQPEANEYFIFTQVDGDEVEIHAVVRVKDIVDNGLIGEPKVFRYKHSKSALYFEQIKNGNIELWRF